MPVVKSARLWRRPRMKAMEQHQRVCVAIERAEAATHHGSSSESGQILPEFGRIDHLKRDFTDLAVYPAPAIRRVPRHRRR